MTFLLIFFFWVLGACTASFMGVVAARLYTGRSIVSGRSKCDACGRTLSAEALVPIASYVFLGGRARCCGARLSPYAPLSEIVLGTIFALLFHSLGLTPALPVFLAAAALLLALVLYDLAHQMLPFPLLLPFILCAGVGAYLVGHPFPQTPLVALMIALFFLLIHVGSRGRALGFADVPLAFGLAMLVGPFALSGLIFSFWIGALCGIAILAGRPRGSRMGVEVPFAPYLCAGFLLAYFTQWNILDLAALSALF